MSNETLLYTQIGSVLTYLLLLFVLYRLLVSSKEATIETLRQQIQFLEAKEKALSDVSPDILLQRFERRVSLLEKELEAAEKEKEPLNAELEDLKRKLAKPESDEQRKALEDQLIAVSQHVALLNMERQQLGQRIQEIETPYLRFLHHANGEVSPGRRQIVSQIVCYLGVDRVIASRPDELLRAFSDFVLMMPADGFHPALPINSGAMTGLRSIGLINDRNELTLVGVSVFKTIAKELKSNPLFNSEPAVTG
jgi:hypothetical protein